MNWGKIVNAFKEHLVPSYGSAQAPGVPQTNYIQKPFIPTTQVSSQPMGWPDILNFGINKAKNFGMSPAVVAGQMADESGRGTSKLATQNNNFFGYGASGPGMGNAFSSPQESVDAYFRLLQTPRYTNAWRVRNNPNLMLRELINAGYNTANPNYYNEISGTPEWRNNL